ncbi:hypothetical protein ElyMa_001642700 [Elysia marginata]|uniref:Mutator-like transposase domain-containing protein n=1 Tax=Elysia marginata TaxID=1093978 RepID=A0AAV4JLH5_9GAST|nr:hypothetical protein ElyMa_001642700 [Elysia marginata]
MSGHMEVAAAELLWARSIDDHRLKYTTMLSDGNAKAFTAAQKLELYPMAKEECVNHVAKRLGSSLRNLVTNCSKRNIQLRGRGTGRLTKETMDQLQTYYDRAIRKSNTVEEKKAAIMATINHCY